ncbi:MAG: hypothetical protein M3Q51_07150 [Pseudomonadota bacterium]|nr:hypothetical protein [Pseudomonadota bacterium]
MRHEPAPLDTDALAAIIDPGEWLIAFVNQAIERRVIDASCVIGLQAAAQALDDAALARLRHAFEHGCPAEGLPDQEQALFWHLLGIAHRVPSAEQRAFAAALIEGGGDVGYDDQDRYVWSLPGGGVDVVLDADGTPVGTAH